MRWSACLFLLAACGAEGGEGGSTTSPSDGGAGGGAPESAPPGPYPCGVREPQGSSCTCDDARAGTIVCGDCCWCSCSSETASLCGTDLTFDQAGSFDRCIEESCCDAFVTCVGPDGSSVDACVACMDAGGGGLCDDFMACIDDACAGGPGICGTGATTGYAELDACIGATCCDVFLACAGDELADLDACIACVEAGGGARCDALVACRDTCEAGDEPGAGGAAGLGGAGGADAVGGSAGDGG